MRLLAPTRDEAIKLAEIEDRAFGEREAPWSVDDFVAFGQTGSMVIADDAIEAALIIVRKTLDEAEILNLGVVPEQRRKGLGAELLHAAEYVVANTGAHRIYLEVAIDNMPARALYAAAGYSEVGRRPNYYLRNDGSRVDALVLSKPLEADDQNH